MRESKQQKKLAFFDFAYTICPSFFVSPFIQAYCEKHSSLKTKSILRKLNEQLERYNNKVITYNKIVEYAIKYLAEMLKGEQVDLVAQEAVGLFAHLKIFKYVEPLFSFLSANGFKIYILTADFEFLMQSILDKIPHKFTLVGSGLEVIDNRFTGNIEIIRNSTFKADLIAEVESSIDNPFTVAFGDSQGDIPMLELADLGFFINENRAEYEKLVLHKHIHFIANPDNESAADEIITIIKQYN